MSKRAVLYARVSKDDRANDGRNLESQLEMNREYALSQDWEIVAELAEDDRGASGASWDLPQLNLALDMAQAGEFDILVTRELDRFARNLAKQLVIEEQFKRHGVKVEYVLGDYAETPEGQLNKQIRAVIAEFEREKIKERMARGRRREVKRGSVISCNRPPYGYDIVHDGDRYRLVINEKQAEIVRLIYHWYTEGVDGETVSIHKIAYMLAEAGFSPPSGKVTTICWSKATVSRILFTETYAGVWHYGKTKHKPENNGQLVNPNEHWIPVNVPAIVDRETWELAQQKRKTNLSNSPRNTKRDYMLTGRVRCIHCNHKMGIVPPANNRNSHYYRCTAAWAHIYGYHAHCENRKNFNGKLVDNLVWNWIKSFFTDPEKLEQGYEQYETDLEANQNPLRQQLALTNELLAENQQKLERLLDLYLSGEIDKDYLVDRKNRLETTITGLNQARDKLNARLTKETVTREQIQTLQGFVYEIGEGLLECDGEIKTKRRFFQLLDLQVKLGIEDGEKVIELVCILGRKKVKRNGFTTRTI